MVRRRRWWCKWSATAMVVVGRDQTRHYYYNCCTTTYCRRRRRRHRLRHRHPTTVKNPNLNCGGGKRGRRGRRLSVRVSAHAPARQKSVAGDPVALLRGRFLNLAGLCGATAADAATAAVFALIALRVRVGQLGAYAAAFNTSLGGEGRERDMDGGGRTDPPWTRCRARWCVVSVVRRVSVCVFENPRRAAAPHGALTV